MLDTTFFALHYFARDENTLKKTKEIIRTCRRLGNSGLIPTIVLAEFYALAGKTAGREVAERYFSEIELSGLDIKPLTASVAKLAGRLRRKYQEKIPWGECLIAATAIDARTQTVVSEDPYFSQIREISTKTALQLQV